MTTRFILLIGLASLPGMAGCGGRPTSPTPFKVVTGSPPAPPITYDADVAPMIARHCLACHDSTVQQGGIALDGDSPTLETWGRVADALRAGTMPPGNRPRPSAAEIAAINGWLAAEVFGCSATDADPGRVTMRRLNRVEYNNTIRELLGLDLHLADAFTADDVAYGFDNNGDILSLPPILMEKYLKAADLAIEAALRSPRAWSKIKNPAPDVIPLSLRKPTFAVRTEPVKRIGRPAPAAAAPLVEDPEVVALRQAYAILRGFADRAYRRPATADELTRLVALVETARKDGDSVDAAIAYALKAALISPSFLFLVEEDPETGNGSKNDPVDDFKLAARLSYFLWSSLPDDELYRLAARNELRRGDTLSSQVSRMLRDDKARALVDGFATGWLQLRSLQEITPDPSRFPDFDEPLRQAMREETERFAWSIIREDRTVFDFLDADHTFVNERLARHYGLPGVVGNHFRRVSLAGTDRRGVLTQASVLTITSNPTRTSPVKRGKWVLDNLLGMPPPPPPAGVEGLKAEASHDRSASLRQQMERHRDDPSCASCHARMDPLGFSLENFDGIGAWRTVDDGQTLDVSGKLPGGEPFQGPRGLRSVLIARRQAFAHCLAEKLLTYAIGRGLGSADRCFVDAIADKLGQGDSRFSTLVGAIVASPPFQNRSQSQEHP